MEYPQIILAIHLCPNDLIVQQPIQGRINFEFTAIEPGKTASVGSNPQVPIFIFQQAWNLRLGEAIFDRIVPRWIKMILSLKNRWKKADCK